MVKVKKDLTGQRFGRWTVIEQVEDYISPSGKHEARWLCQCDCGSEPKLILGCVLRRGISKSCGCYQKELLSTMSKGNKLKKRYNEYDLSGEYGIGYTAKGEEFWFDLEDYDLIKDYSWSFSTFGYVTTPDNIRLHRLVMNPKDNEKVDHIVHPPKPENIVDNRKSNLRIVTYSQNGMNKHIQSNNKSGVPGVCFDNTNKKWLAYIKINKKQIVLGRFNDFDDAVKARKEAEEKYFGEYSFDNSQKTLEEEKGA